MHVFIRARDDFEKLVLPGPNGTGGEEGLHLDFKGDRERAPDAQRKTAIDLAAFANSQGGSVVFGVQEDPARPKFAGSISPNLDASDVTRHVEESITSWTYGFDERPRPEPIDVDGGRVVVVNILPCARLVSVRGLSDPRLIAYPFRHEHGNDYLKPEEVLHRLDTRRGHTARSQLAHWLRVHAGDGDGVPVALRIVVQIQGAAQPPRYVGWHDNDGTVALTDLTPFGAAFRFDVPKPWEPVDLVVPYEWIVSVWWTGKRLGVQLAASVTHDRGKVKAHPMPW